MKTTVRWGIALAGFLILLASQATVCRAEDAAAKPAPVLSTAGSIRDALLQLPEGQPIEITLANGKSYAGRLGAVGSHAMILTKLTGKDFFDALIRIEDVSSVEVRVRGN